MCDSGIKLNSDDAQKIHNMKQKKDLEFMILTIGKPEGAKKEQVMITLSKTKEEVAQVMEDGILTIGEKGKENYIEIPLVKKGEWWDMISLTSG